MQQTGEDDRQIEAAVALKDTVPSGHKAVLDFSEVAMRVFGEVERVVGAGEGGFQVAQRLS